MDKLKVMIRADGGGELGMGHLMRTGVLAEALRPYADIDYICDTNYSQGIQYLKNKGYVVHEITDNKIADHTAIRGDVLITDNYEIDRTYMEEVTHCFKKTVYIDDNAEKVFVGGLLLNQNYNAEKLDYSETNRTGCRLLLGSQYILLREAFRQQQTIEVKHNVTDVLITVGGGDGRNFTGSILNQVSKLPYNFHVVIGSAFPHSKELERTYNDSNIYYYHQPDMAQLMTKVDVAIAACGSTLYELAVLGIPTIGVIVADNQKRTAIQLANAGLITLIGTGERIQDKQLGIQLQRLDRNIQKREWLHEENLKTFNKKGVYKVVDAILAM